MKVSSEWEDWTFNLKTQSWHYDASASIEQPKEYYHYEPTPLPEGPLPLLDADEITTYFENTFGDFVYLIAALGQTEEENLSDFAPYDQLRPEWCFENCNYNIDVGYSEKGMPEFHPFPPLLTGLVSSRVDLKFHITHNTQLNLYFSLRLPLEDRTRLLGTTGQEDQEDQEDFAHYGRLIFGAVIDHWESKILAHFPSTPRPEWCFENRSHNIDVGYSEKGGHVFYSSPPLLTRLVPSRVDFTFHDTHNTRLNLYFSLRLPLEDRSRLRAAYLCQSDKDSFLSPYFIDEIGFSIAGDFSRGLKSCPAPAYLFVPPLHVEYIDGMYYIPHPLPDPLFYWSWDPKGKTVISEKDWEQHGIPELEVETWAGSFWDPDQYELVENHLRKKHYEVDGKQYAQDHGYPELIWADPYARRIMELKDMHSDEDLEDSNQHGSSEELDEFCSSIYQPAYPSTSLFVDLPVERVLAHTGERDIHHETNAQKSMAETRRVREQHARVQEAKSRSDSSEPIAQKPAPLGHSPTSVSYTVTKRAEQLQRATRAKTDARDDTSTRTTRPPAQGKAAAISNSQTQPKRATQKSLGTKTTGVGAGQTSTAARRTQAASRVVTTPSKPNKQPEPEDREVTPAKPSSAPARTTQ
ncbi:hypothetical protein AAF712_015963 [Marasmius tenuissimus]|uniref:Uncharacterized protein n=1 Tax=Marasmius tenuissimus TaxID=585030 RepID=A0ABR2Z6V6_9AGAR